MGNQMTNVLKSIGVCRVSYLETFCEKKSGKNFQGKNYRGVAATPLGCIRVKHRKSVSFRGSTPDPAGGAYDAPPGPLIDWGGVQPLPRPHPLDACGVSQLGAFGTSIVISPNNLSLPYQFFCMTLLQPRLVESFSEQSMCSLARYFNYSLVAGNGETSRC